MQLKEVMNILDAQLFLGEEKLKEHVYSACGCDLMSDVLSYAKENVILLTGLVNTHVIRTAEMAGIYTIVFVRGKQPTKEILDLAQELEISIFSTKLPLYEACGYLYTKGLGRGKVER